MLYLYDVQKLLRGDISLNPTIEFTDVMNGFLLPSVRFLLWGVVFLLGYKFYEAVKMLDDQPPSSDQQGMVSPGDFIIQPKRH